MMFCSLLDFLVFYKTDFLQNPSYAYKKRFVFLVEKKKSEKENFPSAFFQKEKSIIMKLTFTLLILFTFDDELDETLSELARKILLSVAADAFKSAPRWR